MELENLNGQTLLRLVGDEVRNGRGQVLARIDGTGLRNEQGQELATAREGRVELLGGAPVELDDDRVLGADGSAIAIFATSSENPDGSATARGSAPGPERPPEHAREFLAAAFLLFLT